MTLRSLAIDLRPSRVLGVLAACVELSKPRMVSLILVTTLAGFYMASPAAPDYLLLLHTLLGTGFAAAGTLALNQLLEKETDALMKRTRNRPLPGGRIRPPEALAFGAAVTCGGLLYLAVQVNPLSALVTALVVAVYLFAYTPMKQRSALCTLVGAFPGALPPLAGWVAATGDVGAGALVLFGIMFFWQLPHSLAIAWLYRDEYDRAGIRLLPTVERSGDSTRRQIFVSSLALLAMGLLPVVAGVAGWIYFATALALGIWILADATRAAIRLSLPSARRLLWTSLVYVPVVLLAMVLDRIPAV
jgi:protoheme IX farnesyltransferase